MNTKSGYTLDKRKFKKGCAEQMSDTWDMKHSEEQPMGGTPEDTAKTETPADASSAGDTQPSTAQTQDTVTSDAQSASAPDSDAAPAQVDNPVQGTVPPVNGWSNDGSYRYVPPRNTTPPAGGQRPVPPAYQAPNYNGAPRYTSPINNGTPGWTPPSYGVPPTPPTPPVPPVPPVGVNNAKPPRKKGNGWLIAIAILAAAALITCVVLAAFAIAQNVDSDKFIGEDITSSQVDSSSGNHPAGDKAPSLEIGSWDDGDGGLSAKEIVNRNYDSTVVLTAYIQNKSFNFGESNLVEAGASSGIVMSKDGYIITNWHCVTNEKTGKYFDRIDVTTHNGKVYKNAKVVGSDQSTDLAVIRVDAKDLTPAEFGDSSKLSVGDRVVALGNAAGLSWSATQGIVSALARDVYDDTGYGIRCLQVDAAINPGNSGGPLLNNQGLVVGINSSKIVAEGYEGLGFSIPINEAKAVIDSLLKYGYVKGRVALGVTGKSIASGMYNGFMIAEILPNSSLADTEAQIGDLIVGINGKAIRDYGSLRAELAKHKVGEKVTLNMLRSEPHSGQVSSFSVKVVLQEEKR